MKITVFHGSEHIIEKPKYGKGNHYNDYGLGFYCTEHIELAKEWACTNEHGGFVNRYSIDSRGLDILELNSCEYNILNWLAVLLENRQFSFITTIAQESRDYLLSHFLPDYKSRDIIIGYRADDSYFSFAKAFIGNGLSLKQLNKAMYLGNLGEQIVIISKKAFTRLEFEGYEIVDRNMFYPKRKSRDDNARNIYKEEIAEIDSSSDDIYMIDIIRNKWRNEDVRI